MSLWKNSAGPKDAPVWYARQGLFNGKNVEENKVLGLNNTDFATGDCVIYLSESPLSGLSNKGIYYVRKYGRKIGLFDTRAHAINLDSEEGLKEFSASSEDSNQLFIKYDRKETTNQGKEVPALVAVDKATAQLRVGGLVSPGWYRYFKYTDSSSKDRVHLELLAGVKTMVTEGDYSITAAKFTNTNLGDGKWSNLTEAIRSSENKLVFTITTTGPLHKDLYFAFGPFTYDPEDPERYNNFWGHYKGRFTFTCNGEPVSNSMEGAWCYNAYTTIPVNVDSAQTISVEVVMTGGAYSGYTKYDGLFCNYALADSYEGLVAVAEAGFPVCYGDYVDPTPKYELSFDGVNFVNDGYESGWHSDRPNYLEIVLSPTKAFTGDVFVKAWLGKHNGTAGQRGLESMGFQFVDKDTHEVIPWNGNSELTHTVNFDGSSTDPVTLMWEMSNYQRIRELSDGVDIIITTTSTEAGDRNDSGLIDVEMGALYSTNIEGKHGLSIGGGLDGWTYDETYQPNRLKITITPTQEISNESIDLSIGLKDITSQTSLNELGFKFVDSDAVEIPWELGQLVKTINIESASPSEPFVTFFNVSEGQYDQIGNQVAVMMSASSATLGDVEVTNTIVAEHAPKYEIDLKAVSHERGETPSSSDLWDMSNSANGATTSVSTGGETGTIVMKFKAIGDDDVPFDEKGIHFAASDDAAAPALSYDSEGYVSQTINVSDEPQNVSFYICDGAGSVDVGSVTLKLKCESDTLGNIETEIQPTIIL